MGLQFFGMDWNNNENNCNKYEGMGMAPIPYQYTHRTMGILLTDMPYTLIYNAGD